MTVAEYIEMNKAGCCGCYACQNTCPVGAITFEYDDEGFWYPEIDEELCSHCGKCLKVCPCTNVPGSLNVKGTYACYAKDKKELMTSSSGGIFAVLAREVLKKGGYVCGAAFDGDFSVVHEVIHSEEQLNELKGTKYVQSKIGTVYSEIKELLTQNKLVLFSGTPCQVAGLKSYLNRDYDNLITVDLICHGVPSPQIWHEYLNEISEGKKLSCVSFRNKENGISSPTMDFVYEDGTSSKTNVSDNPYYKGFINNYYLRPSCFECKFKGLERCSDITIGDFWAVKEYYPDFDSNYGTSVVIIRTDRVMSLFHAVKDDLQIISVHKDYISVWNECLLEPIKATSKKREFYENKVGKTLSEVVGALSVADVSKQSKTSLLKRVKRILFG